MNIDVNPASEASEAVSQAALVKRVEHGEGAITRLIEQQSAKVSSHPFLLLSLAAMTTSLGFELAGNHRVSRFIGMWPGPLLTMGVYNKLVKLIGAR
jgi:hypothetical protein